LYDFEFKSLGQTNPVQVAGITETELKLEDDIAGASGHSFTADNVMTNPLFPLLHPNIHFQQ